MYKKAFTKFEDAAVDLYINIGTDEIEDEEYIDKLIDLIIMYRMEQRIVVELKDTVNNENINELKDFIAKLKSHGMRVAIDNVGIHYHKMSYLVLLDVDYINIDRGLITPKKDEPTSLILEMISAFVKGSNTNKKLIALKVETSEEYKKISDMGFDMYQGWFLKGKHIVF